MRLFVGTPRWFQDCAAGDLLRVPHRGENRFAFAVCGNANGHADRVAVLDEGDKFPFAFADGSEPVLCYGRDYVLREGMESNALAASGTHMVGAIGFKRTKDDLSATLMGSMDGRAVSVDLATGRVSGARGGVGFNVTRWSLFLLLADGLDPVKVFEATGRAT